MISKGVVEAISRHLPGGNEENHGKVWIADIQAVIGTVHLPNESEGR
jgi:hypothetical protein